MLSRMTLAACVVFALRVNAHEVCDTLRGASVLAQDDQNTFLGKVASKFDSKSIFNEFGNYGSEFSRTSVWNEFSNFGGDFSRHSASNSSTSTPPMFVKDGKILGYLSTNRSVRPSISPNLLKELCSDMF